MSKVYTSLLFLLLNKYAHEGIENIESIEVLRLKPFDEFGSLIEIIKQFGSREKYFEAIKELELYKSA